MEIKKWKVGETTLLDDSKYKVTVLAVSQNGKIILCLLEKGLFAEEYVTWLIGAGGDFCCGRYFLVRSLGGEENALQRAVKNFADRSIAYKDYKDVE